MQPRDYGPFAYVPIKDRPKLEWPGGARLAVWVIPNIEFFPLSLGIAGQPGAAPGNAPSVRAWAQRDYGNRIGIWRLMDETLLLCRARYPGQPVVLTAQSHLVPFYRGYGFEPTGEPFDDFGVAHIDMRLPPSP